MAKVAIKPEAQRALANKMQQTIDYYMDQLDLMKQKMTNMGNFWMDDQYNAFMSTFDDELRKLQSLREDLNAQKREIDRAADEGDAMINSIRRIVQ